MRLYHDYRIYSPDIVQLIGEQQFTELEAEIEDTDVLSCPFCGGEPEVQFAEYLRTVSLSIFCSGCKIRTLRLFEGQSFTGRRYTLHDRLLQAANLWNRRTAPIKGGEHGAC